MSCHSNTNRLSNKQRYKMDILVIQHQRIQSDLVQMQFPIIWKDIHTICLIAISRDFFESVLPKPELSGDEDDFPERLPRGECLSSSFGGASLRMFITLSTIFVPIKTGLTLSLTLECPRFTAGTELPLA